jgi:hypothetical protein
MTKTAAVAPQVEAYPETRIPEEGMKAPPPVELDALTERVQSFMNDEVLPIHLVRSTNASVDRRCPARRPGARILLMTNLENAHALVIGIDTGYERVTKLPLTRDAAAIAALLTNPREGGYAPENVRVLANAAATKQAIQDELADLAARTDPDSIVFVYFSGHGGRIANGPAAGHYLIPVDADAASDTTLAATSLSGDAFTAALNRLPARKVLIIFDCCHAGGIGILKSVTGPVFKHGFPEAYYERLAAGRGRVIFASSLDSESSLVFSADQHGLFTKHLLGGLRGGIPSDDGLIRVFDLFEYVQPRVTAEAGPSLPQHPVFKAHLQENFPVALRLGGEVAAVPKDVDGYRFDAYISYVDREPDATWVWDTLVPRLEEAGLRVAVSGDSADPGVPRLVSADRGIAQAKRTVAVLSDSYLADHQAEFENLVAQTLGVDTGSWRLIPVAFDAFDRSRLPIRLGFLTAVELGHPRRGDRELQRLVAALQGPVPQMG